MSPLEDLAITLGRDVSRRSILTSIGTVAAATLSGCALNPFSQRVPGGHLFIENRGETPRRIAVSVLEEGNGDRLIHQVYRIPEEHVLQFEEILEMDQTYDIRAFQPSIPEAGKARLAVTVDTCEENDPAGRTDISVLASSNGADITVYDCTTPYTKTGELTYADPSEYAVETITGTIPTPTPS